MHAGVFKEFQKLRHAGTDNVGTLPPQPTPPPLPKKQYAFWPRVYIYIYRVPNLDLLQPVPNPADQTNPPCHPLETKRKEPIREIAQQLHKPQTFSFPNLAKLCLKALHSLSPKCETLHSLQSRMLGRKESTHRWFQSAP